MKTTITKIYPTLLIITFLFTSTNADLSLTYFPAVEWRTSTPQEQDVDQDILNNMKNLIISYKIPIDSITIVRNGYLIYKEYFDYYNDANLHEIWSATKSFTNALIGIANASGLITNLDQPILDIFTDRNFTNVNAQKQAITIRHLLKMQMGMNEHDNQMMASDDWVQFTLDQPMNEYPGMSWSYTDATAHLLSAIIQKKTNMNTEEYARQHLFTPLGITDYLWENDTMGLSFGASGLWLHPLDMAKFGYLYLNNGTWNDNQVVPKEWVQESTVSYSKMSSDFQYGYLWVIDPEAQIYYALGAFGQFIVVKPDENLVAIITASDSAGISDRAFEILYDYILKSIGIITTLTNTTNDTSNTTTDTSTSSDTSSSSLNPSLVLGPMILCVLFDNYRKKTKGSH